MSWLLCQSCQSHLKLTRQGHYHTSSLFSKDPLPLPLPGPSSANMTHAASSGYLSVIMVGKVESANGAVPFSQLSVVEESVIVLVLLLIVRIPLGFHRWWSESEVHMNFSSSLYLQRSFHPAAYNQRTPDGPCTLLSSENGETLFASRDECVMMFWRFLLIQELRAVIHILLFSWSMCFHFHFYTS